MADDFDPRPENGRRRGRKPSAALYGAYAVGAMVLVALGIGVGVVADLLSRPAPPPRPAAVAAAPPLEDRLRQPVPQFRAPEFLQDRSGSFLTPPPEEIEPAPDGAPVQETEAAPAPEEPPPQLAFAVPMDPAPLRPLVAVVIDDMGLDRTRSQRMMTLPGPLTLSFLTYADDLTLWAARAKAAGHEVMAHVPMEPLDAGENPGPGALRVAMSPGDVRAQLAADLDPWGGYVGINNHMGSRFTLDRERMDAVMAELKSRGLLWLDSRTTAGTTGTDAAEGAGVPNLARDVFLDNVDEVGAVTAQLEQTEAIARENGMAIAIGHPHDGTIAALAQWLPTLEEKGMTLAPVTALLARKKTQAAAQQAVR